MFKRYVHTKGNIEVDAAEFSIGMESGWYNPDTKQISPEITGKKDLPYIVGYHQGKETPILITGEMPVMVVKYFRKKVENIDDNEGKLYTFVFPKKWFDENYKLKEK